MGISGVSVEVGATGFLSDGRQRRGLPGAFLLSPAQEAGREALAPTWSGRALAWASAPPRPLQGHSCTLWAQQQGRMLVPRGQAPGTRSEE